MTRLNGVTALVTGGAQGMGAAHCRALMDEGANVVVADVLTQQGSALAKSLGPRATFAQLDVTEPQQWANAVASTIDMFGGLDVLVNNAGVVGFASITKHSVALWRKILDVDLTGTFLGIQAVVPEMIRRGRGSIINVSSVQGIRANSGMHGYVAAKFGVRGLTKSTAIELAPLGVRVNSIHPGLVDTPMTLNKKLIEGSIPQGRPAHPEEISSMVVFLASEDSSYCTGAEFIVDGGQSALLPPATSTE